MAILINFVFHPKYLFVTNIFEDKITRFTVKDNYDLVYDGIVAEDNCPASMLFI